ncbi:hypothetical protein [Mycobacterium sp. 48b]|uniref:hypothetical protein n=1 Tax=Mycobacterium sp. 48b TaxID=3400426 RepID=UPI003AAE4796
MIAARDEQADASNRRQRALLNHDRATTSVTAIIALVLLVAVFAAVGVLLILQMSGVFE